MEDLGQVVLEWFLTDDAHRVLALSAGFSILSVSLYLALREYLALKEIRRDPSAALDPTRPGRLPSTVKGWSRRAKNDAEIVSTRFRALLQGSVRLTILGIVVPTVLLMMLALGYTWVEPGGVAVINAQTGDPVITPNIFEALSFVAGALLKGLLFDIIEVFAINVSMLTHSPDNLFFSSAVLLYRVLANLFIVFVPVFLLAVWRATDSARKEIERRAQEGKAAARAT
ncbi:MAG: hypothetical protein KF899_00085 [Parvibaculum sp.]|nr:hypothetical protein [Parvibaculum sp.]